MSLTGTTLAGAVSASAQQLALTSGTGLNLISPLQKLVLQIDQELMLVTDITKSPTVSVVRGWNGTAAAAHGKITPAIFGTPGDYGELMGAPATSYGADGAITIPFGNQFIVLAGSSALAMTLGDPPLNLNAMVTIFSTIAAAHTVDYTAGFYGDTTSSNLATFAAKVGASFTIQALNGKWGVIAAANVTFG